MSLFDRILGEVIDVKFFRNKVRPNPAEFKVKSPKAAFADSVKKDNLNNKEYKDGTR